MANRDVALGLCGVVVGVLLGAGSVLYTQGSTASVSGTDVAYVNISHADRANQPNARAAAKKIDHTQVAPEAGRFERVRKAVKSMVHPSASTNDCMDAVALIKAATPADQRYNSILTAIMAAEKLCN